MVVVTPKKKKACFRGDTPLYCRSELYGCDHLRADSPELSKRAELIDMKKAQDFGHENPHSGDTVYLMA
jgi:hypothetical protein